MGATRTVPPASTAGRSPGPWGRRALGLLVAAAIVVATGWVLSAAQDGPRFTAQDVQVAASTAGTFRSFLPRDELARRLRVYESRVADDPDSVVDLRLLAGLHLDRARATGDVQSYEAARVALEQALAVDDGDVAAATMLAGVRVALHDFSGAAALAEEVLVAGPEWLEARAAAGDARLALGDVDAARAHLRVLFDAAPDEPAVLLRRAELAHLEGDQDAAVALTAEAAAEVPVVRRREAAFYRAAAAQRAFDAGRYDEARQLAEASVELDAATPANRVTLARVLAAQGARARAIGLYEQAVELVPDPVHLAELGDLLALDGRRREAEARYDTVAVIAQLQEDLYDRQLALFYADHDIEPEAALAITTAGLEQRSDVEGHDAHAWALYRNGRHEDARVASDAARALGTRSARFAYHAGLVSAALGEDARAIAELEEALATSPEWSPLQAAHAREVLDQLRSAGR